MVCNLSPMVICKLHPCIFGSARTLYAACLPAATPLHPPPVHPGATHLARDESASRFSQPQPLPFFPNVPQRQSDTQTVRVDLLLLTFDESSDRGQRRRSL